MDRSFTLAHLIERQTAGVDGAYPTAVRGLTLYRRSVAPPPTASPNADRFATQVIEIDQVFLWIKKK